MTAMMSTGLEDGTKSNAGVGAEVTRDDIESDSGPSAARSC